MIYRNEPDGWVAEIPSLPGCYALMSTKADALSELDNVFRMIEAEYKDRGAELQSMNPNSKNTGAAKADPENPLTRIAKAIAVHRAECLRSPRRHLALGTR